METQKNPKKPKKADSDSDSDSDTDINNKYSDEIRNFTGSLSKLFNEDIVSKLTKQEANKWNDCIDKLIRIDKKQKKEIEEVVKWARNDDFWKRNFLSLLKLRKKDSNGIMYYDVFKNNMPKNEINNNPHRTVVRINRPVR